MKYIEGKDVISGTQGQVWIDDEYFAEVEELEAIIPLDKSAVKRVKFLTKTYKTVGATGKGKIKFHKVDSAMLKKMAPLIKAGKQPVFTITSKLNDPDVDGEERIVIRDATFDTLNLIKWSVGKLLEDEYNFTFGDWEIQETI